MLSVISCSASHSANRQYEFAFTFTELSAQFLHLPVAKQQTLAISFSAAVATDLWLWIHPVCNFVFRFTLIALEKSLSQELSRIWILRGRMTWYRAITFSQLIQEEHKYTRSPKKREAVSVCENTCDTRTVTAGRYTSKRERRLTMLARCCDFSWSGCATGLAHMLGRRKFLATTCDCVLAAFR